MQRNPSCWRPPPPQQQLVAAVPVRSSAAAVARVTAARIVGLCTPAVPPTATAIVDTRHDCRLETYRLHYLFSVSRLIRPLMKTISGSVFKCVLLTAFIAAHGDKHFAIADQPSTAQDLLVGKWQMKVAGMTVTQIFYPDGTFKALIDGWMTPVWGTTVFTGHWKVENDTLSVFNKAWQNAPALEALGWFIDGNEKKTESHKIVFKGRNSFFARGHEDHPWIRLPND